MVLNTLILICLDFRRHAKQNILDQTVAGILCFGPDINFFVNAI
jgi:hypothetical protein